MFGYYSTLRQERERALVERRAMQRNDPRWLDVQQRIEEAHIERESKRERELEALIE